jgi:hypothetical protein
LALGAGSRGHSYATQCVADCVAEFAILARDEDAQPIRSIDVTATFAPPTTVLLSREKSSGDYKHPDVLAAH